MTPSGGPTDGRVPLLVRVVGPLVVERDGVTVPAADLGSRRGRTLLKLLAVEQGRPVPLDQVIDVLWPGEAPLRPADNAAVLVSRLRRVLGPDAVSGSRAAYTLGATATTDAARADALVDQAEQRLRSSEPALGAAAATEALRLLGDGVLLPDDDGPWLDGPRSRVTALLARARHAAAEAGLLTGEASAARSAAGAALASDPLDELAVRQLMRGHVAAGEPAKALLAYDSFRQELADSLGVDPAPQTRAVHLATLREQPTPPEALTVPVRAPAATGHTFVGRSAEVAALAAAWELAAAGSPGLILLRGEAGIGKSRLLAEVAATAARTGGTVLLARCYETERSLLLQPFVDALEPVLSTLPEPALRDLAAERLPALAGLFGSVGALVGPLPADRGSAASERRQTFDAVATVLRRLSEQRPVLVALDDLQNAGIATVELVHYVARHSRGARLLLVAGVREGEGDDITSRLAEVADTVELGPLTGAEVQELAGDAGLADLAGTIMAGTRGHPLFVVETIRGIGAGEAGVPASLRDAIEIRVRRTGDDAETLLRAAAVLGTSFDPAVLAGLLGLPATEAARRCEQLLASRLVALAGRDYEFAHDLVREVLYSTTPEPTRLVYHRAAADLLADHPEAVARHAAAIADWQRAGRAWLLAADDAASRYAHADAELLLDQALGAACAVDDVELQARVHVSRSRVREVLASFGPAEDDLLAGVDLARRAGDRRVEMRALLLLGGDVPVAQGRSVIDLTSSLRAALSIAESLADRAAEAETLARLAVLACSQLRFTDAVELGARAVAAARASGDEQALIAALDGAKTGFAYLGDVHRLHEVVQELEPMLRRSGDLMLLQWTVFESSFVPFAKADWPAAVRLIDEAVELSRRSGWSSYHGWFHAHLGWIARLRGQHQQAVEHGRRSLGVSGDLAHPWWGAFVRAMLAATLLETGGTVEATALLEEGLELAERGGATGYRLRCLSLLARATGSSALLEQALELLAGVSAPGGTAWLHGSDVYLALAAELVDRGRTDQAAAVLEPLSGWAARAGWVPTRAQCAVLSGRIALVVGDDAGARRLLLAARTDARAHGMSSLAQQAGRLLDLG